MASFATGFLSPQLRAAVNEAKKKQVVSPDVFNQLDNDNRMYSFTVAGDLTNRQIGGVLKVANTSIKNGVSYAAFKKAFTAKRLKKITSPEPVFVNAVNNVYNKARFEQQNALANIRPFLEYVTAGDEDVRPEHALMNGIVSPVGSTFWQANYPPNGHKCRCQARSLTRGQVMRRGLIVDNTLQAAITRTRRAQIKKGVPLNKIVMPIADKGWKGTWTANEPPIKTVAEKFKTFNKTKWNSLVIQEVAEEIQDFADNMVDQRKEDIAQLKKDLREAKKNPSTFTPVDLQAQFPDSETYSVYNKGRVFATKDMTKNLKVGVPVLRKPIAVFRDFLEKEKTRETTIIEEYIALIRQADGKVKTVYLSVNRNFLRKVRVLEPDQEAEILNQLSGTRIYRAA